MSWRKALDWRFLVALAAALAIVYLVATGLQNAVIAERRDQRADRAAVRGDKLAAALLLQQKRSGTALQAYTQQRRAFQRAQLQLLAQLERVQREQRALIRYVRAQGVDLPPTLPGVPESLAPERRKEQKRSSSSLAGEPETVPREQKPGTGTKPGASTPPATPSTPAPETPVRDLLDGLLKGQLP